MLTFKTLVHTLELISETTSRKNMQKILCDFIVNEYKKKNDYYDIVDALQICITTTTTSSSISARSCKTGNKMIMSAFCKVFNLLENVNIEKILYYNLDFNSINPLTCSEVLCMFQSISLVTGSKRLCVIESLFKHCSHNIEIKYIIKMLSGNLGIGLSEKTIIAATADALLFIYGENKVTCKNIQNAYYKLNNLKLLWKNIDEYGMEYISHKCGIQPGNPVQLMLAQPIQKLDTLKYENITCEYKYDGERMQIHKNGNTINIFSRENKNTTNKYMDVVEHMSECLQYVNSCVLDGEIVAWDRNQQCVLPFSELSKRKTKPANKNDIVIDVCFFLFDILYINGQSLDHLPLCERRDYLFNKESKICYKSGILEYVVHYDNIGNKDDILKIFNDALTMNYEGIIIKTLDSKYEVGKKSRQWLKLKKDFENAENDKTLDTFDVVIVGAWYGKGKRSNVYGSFLTACFNVSTRRYQSFCKLGTGFSDNQLKKFKETFIPTTRSEISIDVTGSIKPDVWFQPTCIWEIKGTEFSLSTVYSVAKGFFDQPKRGLSLRFPRFVRERPDKQQESCTTTDDIYKMYIQCM